METHLKEILEKVTEMMKPHPVYAVGGCCRDYILGNEPKDYDFCTPATPEEIEAKIKASKMSMEMVEKFMVLEGNLVLLGVSLINKWLK